jgi:hypothetical protein
MQATSGVADRTSAVALAQEQRRSRLLEKELGRKERALAEAAALLVLSRKLEALRNRGRTHDCVAATPGTRRDDRYRAQRRCTPANGVHRSGHLGAYL